MEKRENYIKCPNCLTLVDAREHVSQTLEEIVKELEGKKDTREDNPFAKPYNYTIDQAIELIKKRL